MHQKKNVPDLKIHGELPSLLEFNVRRVTAKLEYLVVGCVQGLKVIEELERCQIVLPWELYG